VLKYHAKAATMLPSIPSVSSRNQELLRQRESALGIRFPEAVFEWYSLEGSVEMLRLYSNSDHPVEISKLGETVANWYGAGPRDFVRDGLLWIMSENQGVANWAVRLDGTPDPAVMVEVDSAPNDQWNQLSPTFSEFIFCRIWDHLPSSAAVSAWEPSLSETTIERLKGAFVCHPVSYGWPGSRQLRFSNQFGRILIWQSPEQMDWFIHADSGPSLLSLLQQIRQITEFSNPLFGYDDEGTAVLRAFDQSPNS
jgi:hypothetical protein